MVISPRLTRFHSIDVQSRWSVRLTLSRDIRPHGTPAVTSTSAAESASIQRNMGRPRLVDLMEDAILVAAHVFGEQMKHVFVRKLGDEMPPLIGVGPDDPGERTIRILASQFPDLAIGRFHFGVGEQLITQDFTFLGGECLHNGRNLMPSGPGRNCTVGDAPAYRYRRVLLTKEDSHPVAHPRHHVLAPEGATEHPREVVDARDVHREVVDVRRIEADGITGKTSAFLTSPRSRNRCCGSGRCAWRNRG